PSAPAIRVARRKSTVSESGGERVSERSWIAARHRWFRDGESASLGSTFRWCRRAHPSSGAARHLFGTVSRIGRTQPLHTLKLEERLVFPHARQRSETRLGRDLFAFLRIAQPSAAPWPSFSPARIVHWRALCFEPPKLTGAPIGLAFVFGWKERSGDPNAAAHL